MLIALADDDCGSWDADAIGPPNGRPGAD